MTNEDDRKDDFKDEDEDDNLKEKDHGINEDF
jgi:hypothetical protein